VREETGLVAIHRSVVLRFYVPALSLEVDGVLDEMNTRLYLKTFQIISFYWMTVRTVLGRRTGCPDFPN
jgi:hypothetical protein